MSIYYCPGTNKSRAMGDNKMLGFKEWQQLNENMSFNLGMARTPTVGGVVGGTGISDWALEEAKKKMKKKMMGDEDVEDSDDDADDMGGDDDGDSDDAPKKDIFKKKPKPDMDSSDDDGDDDGDDDDMGGDDDDVKDTPMFMKKKMKDKKKCGKNMKKGCGKAMKNEEAEFWASLQGQMGSDLNQRNWDGISVQEDALISPADVDPALDAAHAEPGPGEVGFAPQQRFGSFGSAFTM